MRQIDKILKQRRALLLMKLDKILNKKVSKRVDTINYNYIHEYLNK